MRRILWHDLVRGERGSTLVIAIGTLTVLSIGLVTTIQLSNANRVSVERSAASATAYSLAESGLNNAIAAVAKVGSDTTKIKPQPGYPGDPASIVVTMDDGTVTWGGTYNSTTKTWTVKSIGEADVDVPGVSEESRTLTQTIQIVPDDAQLAYWNRIYSDLTGSSSGCDMTIYVTVNNPLSAKGNVCLGAPWGVGVLATAPVYIGGYLCVLSKALARDCENNDLSKQKSPNPNLNQLDGSGLGTAAARLNAGYVSIAGNCGVTTAPSVAGKGLHARPCGDADHVFTTGGTLNPPDTASLTLPPVDFAYWRTHAEIGPVDGCDYSSVTAGVVLPSFTSTGKTARIAPTNGSYVCRACPNDASSCASADAIGELSWTKNAGDGNCNTAGETACGGVLKLKGSIYFDGGWETESGAPNLNSKQNINYNGLGSIFFASQGLHFKGGTAPNICAGGDGTYACQSSETLFQNGPPTWNPNVNMLTLYVKDKDPTKTEYDVHLHGGNGPAGLGGAFMGQLWSDGRCLQDNGFWARASINCHDTWLGDRGADENPAYFFTFPPTDTLQAPQDSGTTWDLVVGPQSG